MSGPVAKRYARALFALAAEARRTEAEGTELSRVAAAFADERLEALVQSSAVDPATKRDVVRALVERVGVSSLVARFLGLLTEKNRLGFLPAIAAQYGKLLDRELGRVRARIVSARPLATEDEARIRELFEKATGKKVLGEVAVEPDLVGGVVVEIEGRVYDGSVRTQLEGLRAALSG